VHHADIAHTDERHGDAVRHGHGEAQVLLGGDQRVGLPGKARRRHPRHAVTGDLTDPGRGPSTQRLPNDGEVLVHRCRFVADRFGNVEGIIGGF
jgi:hypothetical protein